MQTTTQPRTVNPTTTKRRGGRRHTDRCASCRYQVARGKACARCTPAQIAGAVAAKKLADTAASKTRIPAAVVAAATRLKTARPALADRINRAVFYAVEPQRINPAYGATVTGCRCADRQYRAHRTSGCKHSIGLWLRQQAGLNATA